MTPPPASGERRTRLLVVADGTLAARVEAVLRREPGLDVVVREPGALATPEREGEAAIVILALPPPATRRALDALGRRARPPAVILLTPTPREAWTARARRSGVRAVLGRDVGADELTAAIAATKAGLLALHPDAVGGRRAAAALAPETLAPLTARELEILEMMAEGMSNRAIAGRLKISRHTVKFHVASILTKLAAHSRTEAVTLGVRQGLISL